MSLVAGVAFTSLTPGSPIKVEVLSSEDETLTQSFDLTILDANDLQSTFSHIAHTIAADLAYLAISVPSYFTDAEKAAIEQAARIPSFHKARVHTNAKIVQFALVGVDYDVRYELVVDMGLAGVAARLMSTEVDQGVRLSETEMGVDVLEVEVLEDPAELARRVLDPVLEFLQGKRDPELKRIVIVDSSGTSASSAVQAFATHLAGQTDAGTTEILIESSTIHYTAQLALHIHIDSKQPKELLIMEVAPLRLGIAKADGFVLSLVRRNTTLPTRKKAVLTTSRDNQTTARVQLVVGLAPRVEDNTVVGEILLSHLPPNPKGGVLIQVEAIVQHDGPTQIVAEELGGDGYPKMGGARGCLDMGYLLGDRIDKDGIADIFERFEGMEHDYGMQQEAEDVWAGDEAQGSLLE